MGRGQWTARLASVGFDTEKAGRPTRRLVYDQSGQLLPGDGRNGNPRAAKAVSGAVAIVFLFRTIDSALVFD